MGADAARATYPSGEEHPLGRLAQQPLPVLLRDTVQSIANEGDRGPVSMRADDLVRAVTPPHQPLGSIRLDQLLDERQHVVVRRGAAAERVERRDFDV